MANTLPTGKSKRFQDLSGQQFVRWKVIEYAGQSSHGDFLWLCECLCERRTRKEIPASNLRRHRSMSCGCIIVENNIRRSFLRGMYDSPEYRTWARMIQRCTNPNNPKYAAYGGRGITVCQRWIDSVADFLADMGQRPSPKHSIDRIDNNGPYSPENCRWATQKEQRRNTRTNRFLTCDGSTKTIIEWAEFLGVPPRILSSRLRLGWTDERAIRTPINKRLGPKKNRAPN